MFVSQQIDPDLNSFLYLKPNLYIFHGAEILPKATKKKLKRLRKNMSKDKSEDEGHTNKD